MWGLAVKLASILGPLSYGALTWLTDNDHRSAMLITGVFFVLGLIVLQSVDPERGAPRRGHCVLMLAARPPACPIAAA